MRTKRASAPACAFNLSDVFIHQKALLIVSSWYMYNKSLVLWSAFFLPQLATYRCPRGSAVMRWDSSNSASSFWGSKGYGVEGRDSRKVRWCSLACLMNQISVPHRSHSTFRLTKGSPQYVQWHTMGLSVLIKILG